MHGTAEMLLRVKHDKRLSMKAKGVFLCLDHGSANIKQLRELTKAGADSIRAGLHELVNYGYIILVEYRNPDGTIKTTEYQVVATHE